MVLDPPALAWHSGQGTDEEEHVHEGMQTSDGGYIAIGHTVETTGRTTDWLIVKVDEAGVLEWQRVFGTSGENDVGIAIAETSDGGYVAGGGLHSSGDQIRALVRLDASGETVWEQTYGRDGAGAVRGLTLLDDGSIVATGYTGSR